MARGSATGFPLGGGEFEGGRGLTSGSTHGNVLGLIALLTNLDTWIKLRGVVDAPADLPTTGMLDGDMYAVKESAGAASPPALYIYNEDTTTWVNVTSTGLPANHASTHLNGGADPLLKAPTVPGAYPYVVLATDEVVAASGGGGGVVVTLPTAVGISGRRYKVIKIDAGVGAVAVTPDGAETINGVAAAYNLSAQWDGVVVESNGFGWLVLAAFPAGLHGARHLPGGLDEANTTPTVPAAYPYVVLATDEAILGTAGGAPVAVGLPTAVGIAGKSYTVVKIDAGVGTVDVTPDGAETINGVAAAYSLLLQWDAIRVKSDGVGWVVVDVFPVGLHRVRHLPGGVDELVTAPTVPGAYPYAVLTTDEVVLATAGGAPVAVTLPTAVGISGKRYVVKKIDAGVGAVNVTPDGVEVIENLGGGVVYPLAAQWDTVTLESDGAGWVIINAHPVPAAHHLTHENGGADELLVPPSVPGGYPYAVLAGDKTVRATAGGAPVVVNLYAALAAAAGRRVTVIKVDAGAGAVNVTPNGAETINGVAALVALAGQWDSITLEIVGLGAWEIVAVTP